MRAWKRLLALFRHDHLDRDLDDEIRLHVELATKDYLSRGYPPAEARRQALLKFGAVQAAKDAHRDSRGLAWLEGLFYDLRYAGRALARDRNFTLTSLVMLALVIGLNVAVFAVVDTMLFRGFPLVKNNRLVYIQERYTLTNGCCLLYADFLAWRDQVHSFSGMAFLGSKPASINDSDSGSRDVNPTLVTANAFGLLGVRPALGRDFVSADELPGAPQVLILRYQEWVTRYGRRADIIGHQLRINQAPATIIGVMPDGFDFPAHGAMWMPLQPTKEMLSRKPDGGFAIGKLTAGATLERARTELDRINQTLEAAFPASNKGVRATARTFSEFELGPDSKMIYGSVWAAAVFVLLIACANLANLTLARTVGRARELSTRIALGAGRSRMARQLFTESALLAIVSGALGWWLGQLALHAWIETTWTQYVVLDYSGGAEIIAYWAGIIAATALLFGFIPIVRILRADMNGGLTSGERGATMSRGTKSLSTALVAGQMALAIVLLAGAGVLARSLWNIVSAEVGVHEADRILVGHVQVPREELPSPETRNAYWDALQTNLNTIPGVETVTLASTIPVSNPASVPLELDGQTGAEPKPTVTRLSAGAGYFRTLGVAMLAGREFTAADAPGTPPVAIVNQSFANQYWPGQSAIGRRIGFNGQDQQIRWYSIIGVASNIMQNRPLRDKFVPLVYLSFHQNPSAVGAFLFVRTRVPPNQIVAKVQAEIEVSAPAVTLEDYSTLQATFGFDRGRMDLEHAELGKHAAVAPIFAILALLLGSVGLYAVVAHSVGQRTKEIGVRMALGALPGKIRRLILGEAFTPVLAGLVIGLAVSLGVNRVLQSQLVGVSPYDAATLSIAPLILLLVAAFGCLLPVRRAMRVDPAVALRHD